MDTESATSGVLLDETDLAFSVAEEHRPSTEADEQPGARCTPSDPERTTGQCTLPVCPFCALGMTVHNDYKALERQKYTIMAKLIDAPAEWRSHLEHFVNGTIQVAEGLLDARGLIPANAHRIAVQFPRAAIPKAPAPQLPATIAATGSAASSSAGPAATAQSVRVQAGVWADPAAEHYVASSPVDVAEGDDNSSGGAKKKKQAKKPLTGPELENFTEAEWMEFEIANPRLDWDRWARFEVRYWAGPAKSWVKCEQSDALVDMYFNGERRREVWQKDENNNNRKYEVWWVGGTDGVQYNTHSRKSRQLKLAEVPPPTDKVSETMDKWLQPKHWDGWDPSTNW